MKKAIAKIGALTAVAVSLSGCVGSNAVTGYVMGFNLKAVDNRYARGGLNMLMAPVTVWQSQLTTSYLTL